MVPGNASGSLQGIALKPLTVDFHEVGFGATLNSENGQLFWFQLSDTQRQQVGDPWGPQNPQALNRYSYVLNEPMKATDPSGHYVSYSVQQAREARRRLWDDRTKIHNARMGGGGNFDAVSVAEDIIGVLVGAADKTVLGLLAAPLAEIINAIVNGGYGGDEFIATLEHICTVLGNFIDDAQSDPTITHIDLWFTSTIVRDWGIGMPKKQYYLHARYGGKEVEPYLVYNSARWIYHETFRPLFDIIP